MKPENLFESIEHVDEKDLEHSESKRVFRPWWAVAAAAALVVMVGLGVLLRPWFGSAPPADGGHPPGAVPGDARLPRRERYRL